MSLYFARPFDNGQSKSAPATQAQTNLVGAHASVIDGLVNMLTKKGKQNLAEKIVQQCCTFIKTIDKCPGAGLIYQAIRNVKPLIEIKNQQSQGRRNKKQKPIPILPHRSNQLAIR
jgi:small subunit ribosomal protein S7